jgi:hypothetical protein
MHYAMKNIGRELRTAGVTNLGTRRRWVVSFTPRLLYSPGNSPPPRTNWIRSRRCGEDIPFPCQEFNRYLSVIINNHYLMTVEGIAPHCLGSGTRWRWVVSFTLGPFYPRGKSPRYPPDRKLGGPRSRSGLCVDEPTVPVTNRTIIPRLSKPWYIHYPGYITHVAGNLITLISNSDSGWYGYCIDSVGNDTICYGILEVVVLQSSFWPWRWRQCVLPKW